MTVAANACHNMIPICSEAIHPRLGKIVTSTSSAMNGDILCLIDFHLPQKEGKGE